MGERRGEALRVNFDRRLKLEFHGAKTTSDGEQWYIGCGSRKACKYTRNSQNASDGAMVMGLWSQ